MSIPISITTKPLALPCPASAMWDQAWATTVQSTPGPYSLPLPNGSAPSSCSLVVSKFSPSSSSSLATSGLRVETVMGKKNLLPLRDMVFVLRHERRGHPRTVTERLGGVGVNKRVGLVELVVVNVIERFFGHGFIIHNTQ